MCFCASCGVVTPQANIIRECMSENWLWLFFIEIWNNWNCTSLKCSWCLSWPFVVILSRFEGFGGLSLSFFSPFLKFTTIKTLKKTWNRYKTTPNFRCQFVINHCSNHDKCFSYDFTPSSIFKWYFRCSTRRTLGFTEHFGPFLPQVFGVLDFEVLIVSSLRFADVVHNFLVAL